MAHEVHLDPEILGAYADGMLDAMKREAVTRHLAACDDCLMAVGFAIEARNEGKTAPPRRISRWLAVAAAVIAIVGGGVAAMRLWRTERPAAAMLIAAVPEARYRVVEPRLAGFPWTPLRRTRAEDSPLGDPDYIPVASAAGEAVRRSRNDSSTGAAHAAAVAELMLLKPEAAVVRLRSLTTRSQAAADLWSDLAAAHYASAVLAHRDGELPLALAAADRALALDSGHASALFNRALILERLGLRQDALAAWERYLALDGNSRWAEEARAHAQALRGTRSPAKLDLLDGAAAAGDRAGIDAFVRASAQDARAWYEVEQLGLWGESVLRGDGEAAAKRLEAIRLVAASLRGFSGESMLADAVAAIDRSGGRSRLAAAHARYRAARLAYRDHELARAERELLATADDFAVAGSPMEAVARFFAACTLFDQNRIEEAAALLEPLCSDRHAALAAQASHQLARCEQYRGRWDHAFARFGQAASAFRRLGEEVNAGVAEVSLGHALHDVGRCDEAWRHRRAGFALLSRAGALHRLAPALGAAARSELRGARWEAARAIVSVESESAQRGGNPMLIADAFRRQTILEARLGDTTAARASLDACRRFTAKMKPSPLRDRLGAESAIAQAIVTSTTHPHAAVEPLSTAIAFFRTAEHRFSLPEALLERGRLHRRLGNSGEAWRDFAEGIDELERQRDASRGMPLDAFFDPAAPLFEEAVATLLEQGDDGRAFAYADRALARALGDRVESAPAALSAVQSALDRSSVLIAFAPLPDGVAAFRIAHDGMEVVRLAGSRQRLEDEVRSLRVAIGRSAPLSEVQTHASALQRWLIAPLALGEARSVVIVAGRELQAVPWAALYDSERRQWLVERVAITVAPSAALWLHASTRLGVARGERLMLVHADPKPRLDALSSSEVPALEALYTDQRVLRGAEATPSRFLGAAGDADVIHFTGHARAGRTAAALLMAPDARWPDGELHASDIARARFDRPRLITLGACSTIEQNPASLEAMPGLATAFLAAGIPAVVGTLWAIEDGDGAVLFAELHRRLREGAGAAAALQDAQLAMIRSGGPRAHPAAWAAAMLVGGTDMEAKGRLQ